MKKYIPVFCLTGLIFFLFLGFEYNYHIQEDKKDKLVNPPKEQTIEKENKEVKAALSESYFELNEQDIINIESEVDTLGERIEVIKNQGNVSFVRGKYGNTQSFYRLYLIDNEGVNIFYEVKEEKDEYNKITQLMEEANYETIFNMTPNQEQFIIKTPYQIGNEWGYGKITSVDNDKITVEYENGNRTIFEMGYGITEMHYQVPEEMKNHFTKEQFTAIRIEG